MPNPSTLGSTAPTSPAVHAQTLADATTTELTEFSRGVYVGGTGDLIVVMGANHAVGTLTTFTAVPAGQILPIGIFSIHSTSTATAVVAIY